MAGRAESVPREHELLCEHCGYGLDGLPEGGRCPECGNPVTDSTSPTMRVATAWEEPGPIALRFVKTTWAVLRRPKGFFRHYRARLDPRASRGFAFAHYWIAGYLFALAGVMHYLFVIGARRADVSTAMFYGLAGATVGCPIVFGLISGIRWLAGRLSALESRYHGLRLPLPVVIRALHYHAAHLLPVAIVTAGITAGYRLALTGGLLRESGSEGYYLYGLCAWVVIAAGYLFWSYWLAMKSVMYANR